MIAKYFSVFTNRLIAGADSEPVAPKPSTLLHRYRAARDICLFLVRITSQNRNFFVSLR